MDETLIGRTVIWRSPTHVDPIIGTLVDIYPEEDEIKIRQGDGTTLWVPTGEVTAWTP